jgi:hypothetical protein
MQRQARRHFEMIFFKATTVEMTMASTTRTCFYRNGVFVEGVAVFFVGRWVGDRSS